ncbi:MAG: hypothetical protein O9320_08715 [Magnetospirillum sp.]|nr:hypothetical protein [Magnetospirillum sp.]
MSVENRVAAALPLDGVSRCIFAITEKMIAEDQAKSRSTRVRISAGMTSAGIDSAIARAACLISAIADSGSIPSSTKRSIKAFVKQMATVDCTIDFTAKVDTSEGVIESVSFVVKPARIARGSVLGKSRKEAGQ